MAMPTARTRALARLGRPPGLMTEEEEFPTLPPGTPSPEEVPTSPLKTGLPEALGMEPPTSPVEDGELVALQAQTRRGMLAADIGRAGAMAAEAISGARAPMELYANLEKRAESPVRDYAERMRQRKASAQAEQEAALRDPFSAESKRRQAAFTRANPALAGRLGLAETPYAWADLEAVVKGTMPADMLAARATDQEQRAQALALQAEAEKRKAGTDKARLELDAKELAERMGLDWAKLSLDRQKTFQNLALAALDATAEATAAQAKAEKEAKGQTLPAGEAAVIGTTEAAISALDELDAAHATMAGGLTGGIASMLPGTEATKYDDKVLATAQAVGTILEGGKLAAGDEVKYRKMLPSAGDSAARRKAKIANVKRLLEENRRTKVKALGDAGYNVSGFRTPAAQTLPKDASGQPTLESAVLPPPPVGKVRIRLPDGRYRIIPQAKLNEAIRDFKAVEVK